MDRQQDAAPPAHMRPCVNRVEVAGDVVGHVRYSKTGGGVRCCSFSVLAWRGDERTNANTRIKINVYGAVVHWCSKNVIVGSRLLIKGELMNRRSNDDFGPRIEVRADTISF